MTKKFWFDWQQRVDETKSIELVHKSLLRGCEKLKSINFDNEKEAARFIKKW